MTTRILLAEEHPVVRQGLRTLLDKEADFEVVAEADSGEAAVRLVGEVKPDVVILDLAMAGLKGLDPVRQIAAAAPLTKVIGLSVYNDRRFVVEVLKAGAFGYLLKDRAFEELAVAIRVVSQTHRTYISQGLSDIVIQDYIDLLRDGEARFRSIFEGSTIGIALVDKEGRIVESNPALQELLGQSQDELRQKEFTEFVPPPEADRCKEYYQQWVAGNRQPYHEEKQYKSKDGSLAWGHLSVSPFRGAGTEGEFAIGMLADISNQKEAEAEIRNYQQKLRSVALELSLTEERERRRLATDLHDHVGQILALAQIKLGALRESVSSSLVSPLEEVRQLLEQTIRYTRSLTFELSPPILYDLGFEAAVEWLAELLQEQYGIRLKVAADRSAKPLSDEIKVLLFQLVRELLVSVAQRAKVDNIAVLISRNGSNMQIKIDSDGAGPPLGLEPPTPNGLELFSIR
ncbi:MAG TPA: PAS domain S-box protein, partial [Desulfobaccales bacterium]